MERATLALICLATTSPITRRSQVQVLPPQGMPDLRRQGRPQCLLAALEALELRRRQLARPIATPEGATAGQLFESGRGTNDSALRADCYFSAAPGCNPIISSEARPRGPYGFANVSANSKWLYPGATMSFTSLPAAVERRCEIVALPLELGSFLCSVAEHDGEMNIVHMFNRAKLEDRVLMKN